MVVVHHMGILSRAPSLSWTTHISAPFAVQAFFVVSGFLVTMSLETSSSILSYGLKRLRRIAPAYVVVVVGAALALSLVSTYPAGEYFLSHGFWRYVLFNLGLSNFAAPELPGVFQSNAVTAVNGSLWTIKIEVAFYCLVPFIVWAVRRFGYRRVLLLLFIASAMWKLGFDLMADARGSKLYADLGKQLPGQLCFFCGGAWAYYRTREGRGVPAIAALVGVLIYAFDYGTLNDVLEPLAVTAIVYWAAVAAPRLPAVGKHGDFSYGTYLYHFPLIQTAVMLGLFRFSPLMAMAIVILAVAICSTLSWFAVESPMLRRRAPHGPML
jgi:peptidoglycan/LPS O-acetylase OafA/YrhL